MPSHLSLVNQKLNFAASLVELLRKSAGHRVQRLALAESLVHQLYMALHFYQRELGENNALDAQKIDSLEDLVHALALREKTPSEVAELQNLASEPDSWLSTLLARYRQLFISPLKPQVHKAAADENLIAVIDISTQSSSPSPEPDIELLESWISQFKALVVRQRETGAEY